MNKTGRYSSSCFRLLLAGTLLLLMTCAGGGGGGETTPTAEGLARSGRWFIYDGKYPYFVGYDLQELFAKKAYTYADMDYKLDQLREFRINKVRVWANAWFKGKDAYYPWVVDENGKKDLDAWDNAYWTRMKDFVKKCKDRDIIVEFTIFAPYPGNMPTGWWTNTDYQIAWNKKFNINNAFSTNTSGHFWPEFFYLDYGEKSSGGKALKDYQKALIDKSIDELNGYGNVYFEVANEFPGVWTNDGSAINQVYRWQQYWADYMHTTKGAVTTVHANEGSGMNFWGIQYFKNESYVDVLNFHFRTLESTADNIIQISNFLHSLQTSGKILQSNESRQYENPDYTDYCTREAWGTFTSGGYYFHYQDNPDSIGTPAWRTNAERLKVLRNVAESVTFWQMSPIDVTGNEHDFLVTQGPGAYWQVLANPGSEYVVYFSANPASTSVGISLPPGTYSYKYYDTRVWDSSGITGGSVTGSGGLTAISAPSASAWSGSTGLVLVIRKTA